MTLSDEAKSQLQQQDSATLLALLSVINQETQTLKQRLRESGESREQNDESKAGLAEEVGRLRAAFFMRFGSQPWPDEAQKVMKDFEDTAAALIAPGDDWREQVHAEIFGSLVELSERRRFVLEELHDRGLLPNLTAFGAPKSP